MNDIKSVLELKKLVFDKIEFIRQGFKNDNPLTYDIEAQLAQNQENDMYRVTLVFRGSKEKEFTFEISLSGFFAFGDEKIEDEQKEELISKNAVAIIMPYMRSQVSLLTAQPGMDCIVLPPFNINNLINEKNQSEVE